MYVSMNNIEMPKVTLLFNLVATQPSFGTKRHGGGIYGEIVLREIVRQRRNVTVVYDSSLWFNPDIKALCESNSIQIIDVKGRTMQEVVDDVRPSIFYSPQPLENLYSLERCDVVVTIHDLRYIELKLDPMFWRYSPGVVMQLKNILWKICPKYVLTHRYKKLANFIANPNVRYAVVSNHSLSSLRLYFPECSHKDICVFYSPSTIVEKINSRKRDADYFLLVSANRWEKNNLRAIMALDSLAAEGRLKGKRAIVTGVKSADEFRYRFKSKDFFEFCGYVSDDELHQLYHDAYCFIYPSLNEGFGYPPMEAMSYGIPVLASPFSSISEVCGDGALYFNPYSVEEIKMRILQIEDPEVRKELSLKGYRRYEDVSAKQQTDLRKIVDFIFGEK